jgi:AcrR family transcriptional regulator
MTATTRATILVAARTLIVGQGYTATSMRQIAEVAGIGKATIYHHFPDKESIVGAIIDGHVADLERFLAQVEVEADPRRRIRVAVESGIDGLVEVAEFLQIVRREVPGARERWQAVFPAFFARYTALVAQAVERGIGEGDFRAVDPQEAARVLMTMLQGTFSRVYLLAERPAASPWAAGGLLDLYFHGLDAR